MNTKLRLHRWILRWGVVVAVVTLAACGGSSDDGTGGGGGTQDAVENTGLISGTTLQSWIDDWDSHRPTGITGKLVILQASVGEAGAEYIAPDGTDVFTYAVDSSEWVETRSNGVTETVSIVPSGTAMDAFLAKYDIDPAADLVVCAQGSAGAGSVMRAGRCWYNFRYWGTSADNVAVLDGGNQWNANNESLSVASTGSTPPNSGTASVKSLSASNFTLQATLEDVIDATTDSSVLIWDARSADEYNGVQYKTKATGATCGADGASQCYTAFEGHPAGAVNLEYSALLNTGDGEGYTFKDATTLETLIDGAGYQDGQTIITYCRTTFRAMVSGIAANLVLGYPVRFYDGGMIEWLQMANYLNKGGTYNLPSDSDWLTDDNSASVTFNASDNVEAPTIVDAYATGANAIIEEDTAYKAN